MNKALNSDPFLKYNSKKDYKKPDKKHYNSHKTNQKIMITSTFFPPPLTLTTLNPYENNPKWCKNILKNSHNKNQNYKNGLTMINVKFLSILNNLKFLINIQYKDIMNITIKEIDSSCMKNRLHLNCRQKDIVLCQGWSFVDLKRNFS